MMKNINEIRQVLSLQKQSLCENYQITEIGIFGSYARGEETEASDIDILVDYETAPTFIMLVELRDYLSQLFGLKVDIVTKNGLKPRMRERVLSEAIYI
ncbi:nucleotidyltransferase family protein [Nodularia sp. UHCC 0506]|uniref:nucleotidyltransferase family protein n=1 Tax=Nodularia sp. UHCC 0506 TaxID=3110243 RepID=UPI002B1EDEF1|nr:nucleotidyltransferase family protein [Nodularia sp. UHCC 0506]MEA5517222.1 nucleotidyltransferase family protein [Nodularia sp. UHCC 0506]